MPRPSLGASVWIALWLAAFAVPGRADENLFGYSYGSETLPKGALELYSWVTWRTGKGAGEYHALDLRQEIEYGVTNRFQASLYLNERYHAIHDSQPFEFEDGVAEPEYPNRDQLAFDGVQAELKYALLSPYEDPIGLAFYVEPGWSRTSKESGEREQAWSIEGKALLQKDFLDDALIAVLNVSPEYEWARARGASDWENELELEVTGGLTYRIAPRWYVGLETRYASEYPNFPDETRRAWWGVFVGPVVHYSARRWWLTATVLPQVHGAPQDPERSRSLQLDDLEKVEVRIKTGFEF
jgi:hypothetical protein